MITLDDIGDVPPGAGERYGRWAGMLYSRVVFPRGDGGIHGKDHCARVLLYGIMIADSIGMDEGETDAVCAAAVFHDSRRLNDMSDTGHGRRGADYYLEYCRERGMRPDDRAYLAMAYHDLPDGEGESAISSRENAESALRVFRVLKDADGLDRLRLGEGALDVSMLRTEPARDLVGFARELVGRTVSEGTAVRRALVVIDVQNDFVSGSLGTPEAVAILPEVIRKVRGFEGEVFCTLDTHPECYLETQEGRNLPVEHCIRGTEGWRIPEGLDRVLEERGAERFEKPTFGSVALAERLRDGGFSEIVLVGLCTDICVVTNALMFKAFMPEVPIRVDARCCAGTTPERHREALDTMRSCQIGVDG